MEDNNSQPNLYQKIAKAREFVAKLQTQKQGKNSFAKYSYFTPEQVESVATQACIVAGIECFHQLLLDEHGYYGELTVIDIDHTQARHVLIDRTAIAEIKGANKCQQLGGTKTYNHRYMLQNFFRINSEKVDIDSLQPSLNKTTAVITNEQRSMIGSFVTQNQISVEKARKILASFGFKDSKEVTQDKFDNVLKAFEKQVNFHKVITEKE